MLWSFSWRLSEIELDHSPLGNSTKIDTSYFLEIKKVPEIENGITIVFGRKVRAAFKTQSVIDEVRGLS